MKLENIMDTKFSHSYEVSTVTRFIESESRMVMSGGMVIGQGKWEIVIH
jgi:hypothetical protein